MKYTYIHIYPELKELKLVNYRMQEKVHKECYIPHCILGLCLRSLSSRQFPRKLALQGNINTISNMYQAKMGGKKTIKVDVMHKAQPTLASTPST